MQLEAVNVTRTLSSVGGPAQDLRITVPVPVRTRLRSSLHLNLPPVLSRGPKISAQGFLFLLDTDATVARRMFLVK